MYSEEGSKEIYSFANTDSTPENIYEPKAPEKQIAIAAENAEQAIELLKNMGIYKEGGFFISDVDNTLRKTVEGTGQGKPGRITESNLDLIKGLRENGWFIGTVSNRSRQIVDMENGIAEKLGYKSYAELKKLSDFDIYGEGGMFNLSQKSNPETVERVVAEIEKMDKFLNGELKTKHIVWIGDSYGDEAFGKNLMLALRERGYPNGVLIKLPDRLGDNFEHSTEI